MAKKAPKPAGPAAPPPKAKSPEKPPPQAAAPMQQVVNPREAALQLEMPNFTVETGIVTGPQRIVIYGPGGVGKTELCSLLQEVNITPYFIDLDEGSDRVDVERIKPTPTTFEHLIGAVRMAGDHGDAVVIDSGTKAEELAVDFTLRTVPHEKGHMVSSIEGYGFGKGYVHTYESFLLLLQALDAVVRKGKHVIVVCHDCVEKVPNPQGEDWIRYEPRLFSPPSGKGSIRHRIKEWCDHMFYVGFDTFVGTDGKASGSGTRTIYPTELPTWWAKSRELQQPIPYQKDNPALWVNLFHALEGQE